jgi:hypothetical protein
LISDSDFSCTIASKVGNPIKTCWGNPIQQSYLPLALDEASDAR